MSDHQHPYAHMVRVLEERLARAEVRLARIEVLVAKLVEPGEKPADPPAKKGGGK